MKDMFRGIALGIVATLLVGVAVWLIVAYSGAYNVAASDRHADAVRWTLDTTMHRSVSSRAGDVALPETFPDEVVATGAGEYAEYCAHCHGAPGSDPAGWSRGMRPEPPHLTEAAAEWTPEEIHWIVENGIKMSGMPAFGPHHEAEEIIALTAFVTRLPGLTAEDYAALTGESQQDAPDQDAADGAADTAPSPEPADPPVIETEEPSQPVAEPAEDATVVPQGEVAVPADQ